MFRLSRNPMCRSMALALLGWAAQERALAEKFGLAYEEHRRPTRRWL